MADGDMTDEDLADGDAADGDLPAQISRLEARIDGLAETLERCRKIALVSKAAIAAGAIVVFGSNRSTSEQTAAGMRAAEALRAELIGRLELRVVDGGLAEQES